MRLPCCLLSFYRFLQSDNVFDLCRGCFCIFSLKMCISRLDIYISSLKICIFRLEIQSSWGNLFLIVWLYLL